MVSSMVKFFFPSILYNSISDREIEISSSNLGDAINKLAFKYGDPFNKFVFNTSGEVNRHIKMFLNGKLVDAENRFDEQLSEKDQVKIIIIISGG